MWEELLSDEEDEPFQNNDSYDEYCPLSDVSNSDTGCEEDETTLNRKHRKFRGYQEHILDGYNGSSGCSNLFSFTESNSGIKDHIFEKYICKKKKI